MITIEDQRLFDCTHLKPLLVDYQPFPAVNPGLRNTLYVYRRWLLANAFLGTAIGLILGYTMPVRYTSTIKLLPELQANQAVDLQPFRELAESMGHAFDTKLQVEAIRPDLYPNILESTPFALSVLHQPVTLRTKQRLPLYQLLTGSTWPLNADPVTPLAHATDQPIRLTRSQRELVEELHSLIQADLSVKSGIMIISSHMPEPEVAAQVVQFSADYLQTFVREYRTEKARANEQFAWRQLEEARRNAYQLERAMLTNQDETRFMTLPSAGLANRRLSSQYETANTLYGQLKREHASAKIQVQTVTPVFKVLEPAQVPDRRSSPRRLWLVLAGSMSGLVMGTLTLLARKAWH